MTVPFVDLKRQFRTIEPEIRPAIEGVLESCAFIMGPEMRAFEQEFARYCDVRHCVGVASGTAAIELALRALDIGPGDEVIIPANTYVASALAVTATGASVVLVDVDPVSANIDADVLERAFTPRTKAIMPVHLYGRPADMESILAVARRHGCFVVEDAAQAHGARYRDRLAGGLADIACFSFYPGKNLGAYGDGGAVTTNDPALYDRLILLRDFGQRRKYEHLIKGTNSRLDTLQAAILSVKLRHLDRWNARRREAAQLYNELLRELPDVAVPDISKECESVFHLYVIEVPD
ncbi:MAG: DegT/DnrJ/EryC1/StrS family aminotransferase, partial [Candidatus Eremiobacteraeota bacterium]|nr:DegT/DnrJ/EryC1/StrS family aminotransferase [Candidatus Eremiobacteraeota bacterium]